MVIKNFNDTLIEFRKLRKELDVIRASTDLLSNQIKEIEVTPPEVTPEPPDVVVIPGGDSIIITVNGELVE